MINVVKRGCNTFRLPWHVCILIQTFTPLFLRDSYYNRNVQYVLSACGVCVCVCVNRMNVLMEMREGKIFAA